MVKITYLAEADGASQFDRCARADGTDESGKEQSEHQQHCDRVCSPAARAPGSTPQCSSVQRARAMAVAETVGNLVSKFNRTAIGRDAATPGAAALEETASRLAQRIGL